MLWRKKLTISEKRGEKIVRDTIQIPNIGKHTVRKPLQKDDDVPKCREALDSPSLNIAQGLQRKEGGFKSTSTGRSLIKVMDLG